MIRIVIVLFVLLPFMTLIACETSSKPSEITELRGIYLELHGNVKFGAYPLVSDGDWRKLFCSLRQLGLNAVFPNVVSPSGAIYPSQVVPPKPASALMGFKDLLAELVAAAHDEGLEIHPWTIEWYHAPEDIDQDRLVHDSDGNTHNTLCPSLEANRELMRQMLLELVRNYDLDGIQYDYMRLPGSKYCYCPNCRAGFEKTIGRTVDEWPADVLAGGKLEGRYTEYLEGNLTSFVREMYFRIKQIKPSIVISAAVWCHDSLPRHPGVRQNWGMWVENGWLDFIAPMNYGNKWVVDHFEVYARNEAKHVIGKMPLVFGLGAYLDTPESQVEDVRLSRELGGDGFIIYTLTEKIFNSHLPALSREVWSTPARVPAFGRR